MTYSGMAAVLGSAFAAPRPTTVLEVAAGDTIILEYDGFLSQPQRDWIKTHFREGARLPDTVGVLVKDGTVKGPTVLRLVA